MSREANSVGARPFLQTVALSRWSFLLNKTTEEHRPHLPGFHLLSQFERPFPAGVMGGRALRRIARDVARIQHTARRAAETG
jgi:hypothetical protein